MNRFVLDAGALLAKSARQATRRFHAAAVLAVLGLCFVSRLVAAPSVSTPAAAAPQEPVRCVSLEYPPAIMTGADGTARGFAVDIVSRVFRGLGRTVEVEIMPWTRALMLIRNGERDCIFTVYVTPDRRNFIDFSEEVLVPQPVYFYRRRGSPLHFNGNFMRLHGAKVGVVSTISYGRRFDDARGYFDIETVQTHEQNFLKLALGRLDLVPSNQFVARYTLRSMDPGVARQIERVSPMLELVPSYIGFSKKRELTGLRGAFDREFRALVSRGEYAKILSNYDLPPDTMGTMVARATRGAEGETQRR